MGKQLERVLHPRKYAQLSKSMQRCQALSVTRGIGIKTTAHGETSTIEQPEHSECWQGRGGTGALGVRGEVGDAATASENSLAALEANANRPYN